METLIADEIDLCFGPSLTTLAFSSSESGNYLVLSYDDDPSDQDKRLGHDCTHLEINDQSHSNYCALLSLQLVQNTLTLEFASARLGMPLDASPINGILPNSSPASPELQDAIQLFNAQRS